MKHLIAVQNSFPIAAILDMWDILGYFTGDEGKNSTCKIIIKGEMIFL